MAEKILLVDDDVAFVETLAFNLRHIGYRVVTAANGAVALQQAHREEPDLIILDLMLPELDGLTVCRNLRQTSDWPILMLTARTGELDKIIGLESGADDYLTKPFHMEELLARLRALIRRAGGHASSEIVCGPLTLDTRNSRATVAGQALTLTSHEYRVLAYLMHHRDKVVSRSDLVEHIYAQDFDRDSNTVEVFIARLRKKLPPGLIETVRGLGYRLTAQQ